MTDDDDLATLVVELRRSLEELEDTLDPPTVAGIPRPPTPREFARFTSEVAIPGAILVLRTNIEALRLLQRTLRMADGRSPGTGTGVAEIGDRARAASRASLDRLDAVLADLQAAIEGRPPDGEARDLIERTRELRDEVDARLASSPEAVAAEPTEVPVDVEAELQSIRRAVEDERGDSGPGDGDNTDGPAEDEPGDGDGDL